jgi:hypothetical protein
MDANSMRSAFNQGFEASRLGNMTFNDREVEFFLNKAQLELIKERYAKWKNPPQIGFADHSIRNSELAGLLTSTKSITRNKFIVGNEDNGALYSPDLDRGGDTQEEDRFGVFVGFPDEMLYPILERVNTEKDGITKRNVEVKEISLLAYNQYIYNSFEKPYDNLVWSMDWGTYTPSYLGNNSSTYTNSTKTYTTSSTNHNMTGLNYLGATIYIDSNRSRYLIPGKGWKITDYMVQYIKLPSDIHIDIVTPSLQKSCELADFLHQEIVDKAVKIAAASIVPVEGKYQINTIESDKDA